jgi:DNA modification methylase
VLPRLPPASAQMIMADPPYFKVLAGEAWDHSWETPDEYLEWCLTWARECRRLLRPDGLMFVFGQPGKREHVFMHLCSALARELQFHDLIVWDRAVGYNERRDSFTPQYELILALRHTADSAPYFNKDAVRVPYDEKTIRSYIKDKRYRDPVAREAHLRKGKYATNILRVPSLKGTSKEKAGHPSQKPEALIEMLVLAASRPGDLVLDPFLGSGTTAVVAARHRRRWIGIEKDPGYAALAAARIRAAGGEGELLL